MKESEREIEKDETERGRIETEKEKRRVKKEKDLGKELIIQFKETINILFFYTVSYS